MKWKYKTPTPPCWKLWIGLTRILFQIQVQLVFRSGKTYTATDNQMILLWVSAVWGDVIIRYIYGTIRLKFHMFHHPDNCSTHRISQVRLFFSVVEMSVTTPSYSQYFFQKRCFICDYPPNWIPLVSELGWLDILQIQHWSKVRLICCAGSGWRCRIWRGCPNRTLHRGCRTFGPSSWLREPPAPSTWTPTATNAPARTWKTLGDTVMRMHRWGNTKPRGRAEVYLWWVERNLIPSVCAIRLILKHSSLHSQSHCNHYESFKVPHLRWKNFPVLLKCDLAKPCMCLTCTEIQHTHILFTLEARL